MDLNSYIQELSKQELLEPEQEKLLWQQYKKAGDDRARRTIIESYQPLVFKIMLSFKGRQQIDMDMIQEGTVGLIEAAENYDAERGVAFSLYAAHRIRGRILNFLAKEYRNGLTYAEQEMYNVERPELLEIADTAPTVAEQVEKKFLSEQVHRALLRLPAKEQVVLEDVYLKEHEPKFVAEELAVSTSHIYRLQKQGVRRLRGMMAKLMHHWK